MQIIFVNFTMDLWDLYGLGTKSTYSLRDISQYLSYFLGMTVAVSLRHLLDQ